VLSETIGKLPALKSVLDEAVQLDVFPLLRPCLFAPGELVYRRGEPAEALLFLLEGQVDVLESHGGAHDAHTEVVAQIDHWGEHLLYRRPATGKLVVLRTLPTGGTFGESVFVQSLRGDTVVASRPSKGLYMTRDDLLGLGASKPQTLRRLRHAVLRPTLPRHRMQRLASLLCQAIRRRGSIAWAASVVQSAWQRQGRVRTRSEWIRLELKRTDGAREHEGAVQLEDAHLDVVEGWPLPIDRDQIRPPPSPHSQAQRRSHRVLSVVPVRDGVGACMPSPAAPRREDVDDATATAGDMQRPQLAGITTSTTSASLCAAPEAMLPLAALERLLAEHRKLWSEQLEEALVAHASRLATEASGQPVAQTVEMAPGNCMVGVHPLDPSTNVASASPPPTKLAVLDTSQATETLVTHSMTSSSRPRQHGTEDESPTRLPAALRSNHQ